MQSACAILSSVARTAVPYFSALSHKWHDFRKKKIFIVHKMCVLILSATFGYNVSLPKKNSASFGVNVRSWSS